MTPVIISRWFGDNPVYHELGRVLRHSAIQHCPNWTVDVHPAPILKFKVSGPPEEMRLWREACREETITVLPAGCELEYIQPSRYECFPLKVESWAQAMYSQKDGTLMAFLDADTLVTGGLDPLRDIPFDIAVTERQSIKHPINSGVVFARVSERSCMFLRAWAQRTRELQEHDATKRYSDQDALIDLVANAPASLHIARLPCRIWNCEQSNWQHYHEGETKIVHIKSDVRKKLFYDPSFQLRSEGAGYIYGLWKWYQKDADDARAYRNRPR